MNTLNSIINNYKERLPQAGKELIEEEHLKECSKFPFNRYTNIFSVLLKKGDLTYEEYTTIRDEYFNRNPNLDLFEMAPRTFGQTWGEKWLLSQKQDYLTTPPIRAGYVSQFDLWLPLENDEGIRIEVKSSRVVDLDDERPPVEKAYKKPQAGTMEEIEKAIERMPFEMNFQQLKPSCCDVFIWMAVWLDDIDIWVIPSSKILMRDKKTPRRKKTESIVNEEGLLYMGSQHQGGKGGETPEGQIFINNHHYKDLSRYKVTIDSLILKIKEYGNAH